MRGTPPNISKAAMWPSSHDCWRMSVKPRAQNSPEKGSATTSTYTFVVLPVILSVSLAVSPAHYP